ncbi:MAG: translocation/assembly module TamB domain-containing protein [Labilithrix sp.]|nr:translocation/assembly module TamB domain-containing protein [Labilithrix sp.]
MIRGAAKSLALGAVFVSGIAGGVLVHADLAASKRLVASVANEALAKIFEGRLVVGRVKTLSLEREARVHVAEIEVRDPEARRVLLVNDVDATIDLAKLLRSLSAGGVPDVAIRSLSVAALDVTLDADAEGKPTIARAFATRPSSEPTPTPPSRESVALVIPKAAIERARVRGNLVPPAIDANADDLALDVRIAKNVLTVDVPNVIAAIRSPRGPDQSGPIRGRAKAHLIVPLGEGEPDLELTFEDGDIAGIPFVARAHLAGGRVTAAVDVPSVAPEIVARAFPNVPIAAPSELHVAAEGALPTLAIHARASAGTGVVRADGEITLTGRQPFRVDASFSHIDGAALTGKPPATDISGTAHAEGELAGGSPTGRFEIATQQGVIAGEKAPAIDAKGTFDARTVSASVRAREPGLDVDGKIDLNVASETLAFDVRARAADLRRIARVRDLPSGSAAAHATGRIDLARGTIAGRASLEGENLAKGAFDAQRVHAEASISGPLAAPVLDVTAEAGDVRITADGKEPLVYPHAKGHARVSLAPAPKITGVEVQVDATPDAHGATSIVAHAAEIEIKDGGVVVREGRVTGLGAPLDVDAHVGGGKLAVRARGADVDMGRAATMTGIQELRLLPEGSRGSIDVALTGGARPTGHVDLVVRAGDGRSGEIHAVVDGKRLTARGRVDAGAMGWVELGRAELELPGPPSAATIARATGSIDLSGQIDLAQGAALFAGESVEQVTGALSFSAHAERGDAKLAPRIVASARTRELDVTLPARDPKDPSVRVSGVDGLFHVAYDGATDETEVAMVTWDRAGVVASANAKSRVPVAGWITGARRFDRSELGALQALAIVDVPRRKAADLPGPLARPELDGFVSARIEARGSLAEPRVTVAARAEEIQEKSRGERRNDVRYSPIDALLRARWDGDRVVAALSADERDDFDERQPRARRGGRGGRAEERKREPGRVRGLVLGRLDAARLLSTGELRWNASAELDVKDMELGPLPIEANVRGALTSRARLRDLNGEPSLVATAHIDGMTIENAPVGRGDVKLEARNESLAVSASVRQDDGGKASFDITSRSLLWRGVEIDWDDKRKTHIEYSVAGVRLAMLRPIVRRQIPEIDGRLDGEGNATVDADQQIFEGGLALSKGRMYVNALGEELRDVEAIARFERNGVFRVQDARGKVGLGELKASATGRMKGLHFGDAEAVVVIPSKDGVPLSSEGATFAQATGEVRVAAKMSGDGKQLLVAVAVPRAKVELPDRGTQQLQSLDPDEAIAVGIRKPDGRLAPEVRSRGGAANAKAAEEFLARFAVTLGDDVLLEGRGLRLYLSGRTLVDIAREIAVSGQISLKSGGTIDVQGRKFVVDRGTATFTENGDPQNPVVLAAAYWDAPDRTRIWVEFSGPIKTGKLTLRSEPPFSKNEILSILLFGRPDPNAATGGNQGTGEAAAGAVGGGIAAAGLSKALSELSDDVDLEQDRTSGNRVRTKVGYRLRRNLKVQLGYASGFSTREPDTTYLFLEWQFVPKWSLIGTRGDRGTSILDVLFQHRY